MRWQRLVTDEEELEDAENRSTAGEGGMVRGGGWMCSGAA